MSRSYKDSPKYTPPAGHGPGRGRGRQRNISVRAVRRDPPDLRKLSRALISLAMDEAAAKTEAAKTTSGENNSAVTAETETAADD